MNRSATLREKRRAYRKKVFRSRLFNNSEIITKSSTCEVNGRGGLLIMCCIVFVALTVADLLFLTDSLDQYDKAETDFCNAQPDLADCEKVFYGANSSYTYAKNAAYLRLSVMILNAVIILATWFNQCLQGAYHLSLPWSQLAFAYIIAIAWYLYIFSIPKVKYGGIQELYDSVRPAGAITILQLILTLCINGVNVLLIKRRSEGESVYRAFIIYGGDDTKLSSVTPATKDQKIKESGNKDIEMGGIVADSQRIDRALETDQLNPHQRKVTSKSHSSLSEIDMETQEKSKMTQGGAGEGATAGEPSETERNDQAKVILQD